MATALSSTEIGEIAPIEAEASLLGALMTIEGEHLITGVAERISPTDFYEPVHARLFERIIAQHAQGKAAAPHTLACHFEHDEGLKDLGGVGYLARLSGDGSGLFATYEIADNLRERAQRRRLIDKAHVVIAAAGDPSVPLDEIPQLSTDLAPTHVRLPTLDLVALSKTRAKPRSFAIERIAPMAETTLFTGPGTAGKSLLGQQLATAGAASMSCLGLSVQPGPTLYLTCEDDEQELHRRQEHLCAAVNVRMEDLAGKLHLTSLRGELGTELATFTREGKMVPTAAFQRLSSMLRDTGAKLAILDNVGHLFTGNENDRGEVTQFVNLLNKLAGDTGAAIVLLAHPNKQGDEWSGSTAWSNAVRSRIYLEYDTDTEVRTLTLPKANYGQKGEVVRFRWVDWAFWRDEDLPANTRAELAEVVKANGENAAFLRCLDQRIAERRHVSEKVGANYAPKVFAAMPEARGLSKDRLTAAMDRLFRIGEIERGFLWRDTAEGKDIFGLRKTGNVTGNDPETRSANDRKPAAINRKTHPLDTSYLSGAAVEAAAPMQLKGD